MSRADGKKRPPNPRYLWYCNGRERDGRMRDTANPESVLLNSIQKDSVVYRLVRTKRKTIAIYIRYDGVEVRAPIKMPKQDIDRFVMHKMNWIEEKTSLMQERSANRHSFNIGYCSYIRYRGALYPIKAGDSTESLFNDTAFIVPPNLSSKEIKNACIHIYRIQAKVHIEQRTAHFAKIMALNYASVGITGAQKQWGSCTSKKRLNFSWRLMMADDDLIDYVIVHELAHTVELNHSARFWAIVEGVMPDYRSLKARLNSFHKQLMNENWNESA